MAAEQQKTFLDRLRECELLEAGQLEELARLPEAQDPDPRTLGKLVLQRGWLSRFQVSTIASGRGKDLFIGPYVLLDRLGEGGMGQVYKAQHRHMSRLVALKLIRKEKLVHPDAVKRFYQEVQAAGQLHHPNIVLAYDANQAGGIHYLAMEFVDGIDLARLVKERGPLPVAAACDYVRQAALGLQHAHERGLVHRDIKPHNLLVTRQGGSAVVKVLDMGLARWQGAGEREKGLTQTGAVIGTPDYLPPEQAVSSRKADIRSDLYSLGCTLYYLLTGQPPFQADSVMDVLLQHQTEEAVALSRRRPEVPAGLQAVVHKLMAKRPEARYQTPAEAAAALELFCRDNGALTARQSARAAGVNDGLTVSGDRVSERASKCLVSPDVPLGTTVDHQEMLAEGKGTRLKQRVSVKPRRQKSTGASRRLLILGGISGGAALLLVGIIGLVIILNQGKPQPTTPSEEEPSVVARNRDRAEQPVVDPRPQPPPDPPDRKRPNPDIPKPPDQPPAPDPNLAPGELCRLLGHGDRVTGIAFLPDGNRLLSGSADRTVVLWDVASGKEVIRLQGHRGEVTGVAVSTGGTQALSCDTDGWMNCWDLKERRLLQEQRLSDGPINGVAIAPDGVWGLFAHSDGNLQMRALHGAVRGVTSKAVGGRWKGLRCVAYSGDNRHILFGTDEGEVHYWDVVAQRAVHQLAGHKGAVLSVAVLGTRGLSGSADGSVRVWDLQAGRMMAGLSVGTGPVTSVAFASDGDRFVWGGQNGNVFVHSPQVKQFPLCFRGHTGSVNSVAFAPDGRSVASASDDRTIRLWDVTKEPTPSQ
jgi:serine/threonine protein kinase